jgi:hypothetical protein
VLHDELQLLETAIGTLDRLVLVLGRAAGSFLRLLLIGPTEAVDLLTQAANLATKRIDDRVELRVEVIGLACDTRLFLRDRSITYGPCRNAAPQGPK